ncbi:MAG: hypothetical protein ABFD50_19665, partial [Smithella sp.]
MADPNTVVCRNCFRCIQECPRGALEKSLNQDYLNIGGPYWKSDFFITLWKQAEDGKVPVSGAGYRGQFSGQGFDSMWTDMSEIVRPTRDGIHGREYISTSVELGRKLNHLSFDENGKLLSQIPDTIDIPIPIIFDVPMENLSSNVLLAQVRAAAELGTCIVLPADHIPADAKKYMKNVIPLISSKEIDKHQSLIKNARMVALDYTEDMLSNFPALRDKIKKINNVLTIIRVPANKTVEKTVSGLARNGAEIIHMVADYRGMEINGSANESRRLGKDI